MAQKLELTWIGKDVRPRLEPRILLEDPDLSYHADARTSDVDLFDNRLIFGDNLLALRALEQEFSGKIKCACLDPPYNTGSAFTHYDDGIEHSTWLGLMRERLEIINRLLSDAGSLWICIDDNEGHYLKVLCDEVFGRKNFVTTAVWQKKYAAKADSRLFSSSHDFILVYAKHLDGFGINRLPKTDKQTSRYINKDSDPRGPWKPDNVLRNEVRDYAIFPVVLPSGRQVRPPAGTSWRYNRDKFDQLIKDNRIWFGLNGDGRPAIKRFLSEVVDSMPPETIWGYGDVGHNDEAKKESKELFGEELFGTPKPERLIERIMTLATNPGDLVLDSFAGSGTTGAVAHKMGRRWIMIELGEHCHTHIIPRMKKVVDGTDQRGISKAVDWKGGGGFRYYKLAPSLLEKDKWGNWVISKEYNAAMLAEAMCKLEGFRFAPSETVFWQQGQSTERDFIYTTTQTLGREVFAHLSEEVGPDRSLLVCCMKFDVEPNEFPNLTIRKIPNAVLGKCEFGHDDYSLEISNLPQRLGEELDTSPQPSPWKGEGARNGRTARKRRGYAEDAQVASLFGDGNGGEGGTSPQPSPWKGEGV